jgi:hypothetical protein
MKCFLTMAFVAVLALAALPGASRAQELISGSLAPASKISATAANTAVTFPTTNGASTGISVLNTSATDSCWVKINGVAVADATSTEIPPGAKLTLTNFSATGIGIIMASGKTATVYVYETAR